MARVASALRDPLDRADDGAGPVGEAVFERERPVLRLLLVAFMLALALRQWLPELFATYRLDENLTAWITSGDFPEAISRSWRHQGQSPMYFGLLWLWQQMAGSSEVALRVPSLIAGAAAAWNLRELGTTLDRRFTGELAGVLLFGFSLGIADARPYIFMILSLIVAARLGVAWATTTGRWVGVAWIVAAAFALYMHPFAAYALLAQGVWLVAGLRASRSRGEATMLVGLGALLVAPIVPQIFLLQGRQAELVLVDLPDAATLISGLVPLQVGAGIAVGMIWCRRYLPLPTEIATATAFVGAWAVAPPLGLFVQSHLTGSSVFLEHYHAGAFPALALAFAMIVGRAQRRWTAAIAVGAFAATAVAILGPTPSHDWEAAVEIAYAQETPVQVWTMSAYIEASNATVFDNGLSSEYLNAPFRVYGADGPLIGVPLGTDTQTNAEYVEMLVRDAVDDKLRVVIIQRNDKRYNGADRAADRLVAAGFEVIEQRTPAGLTVTILDPQ